MPAVLAALLGLHFLVRHFRVGPSLPGLCLSTAFLGTGVFFLPEMVFLLVPYALLRGGTLMAQKRYAGGLPAGSRRGAGRRLCQGAPLHPATPAGETVSPVQEKEYP